MTAQVTAEAGAGDQALENNKKQTKTFIAEASSKFDEDNLKSFKVRRTSRQHARMASELS